jgi:hypothetical protein
MYPITVEDESRMKAQVNSMKAGMMALALALATTTGCVLVVGGDGDVRRADVEWDNSRDTGVTSRSIGTDGRLAREVGARISVDTALSGQDVTVSSSGDVVTLHGRVTDITLLEHAMRVAADVPGVARVVSRLTVEMEAG